MSELSKDDPEFEWRKDGWPDDLIELFKLDITFPIRGGFLANVPIECPTCATGRCIGVSSRLISIYGN
jgi:hypothetical protein